MRCHLLAVLAACSSTPAPSPPSRPPGPSAPEVDKVLDGDATIRGEDDVSKLEAYTKITGFVVIYRTKLTSLRLPSLTSIGGDLQINHNEALGDLNGL